MGGRKGGGIVSMMKQTEDGGGQGREGRKEKWRHRQTSIFLSLPQALCRGSSFLLFAKVTSALHLSNIFTRVTNWHLKERHVCVKMSEWSNSLAHLVATLIGVSPRTFWAFLSEAMGVARRNSRVRSCKPCDTSFMQAKWSTVSPSSSTAFQLAPLRIKKSRTGSWRKRGEW